MNLTVHYKVNDDDIGQDDVVGEGTCTLEELCNAGQNQQFTISHNE